MTEKRIYTLGYVDEADEDIREFQRAFSKYFKVIPYIPNDSTTLDDIIVWKNEKSLDILIVDFNLKENQSIKFYGNTILEYIGKKYLNFPMFMFTGYEQDALYKSDPSIDDLIYEKEEAYEKSELLAQRIINKIEKYKQTLEKSHEEHDKLVKKDILSLEEEEKLLRLELFLEESYDGDQTKPMILKRTEYLEKLNQLIYKADLLLKEIDKDE